MRMDYRQLEEVAMNAWPALQQVLYDGWVLRFANGYTKRANSVNPLYDSRGPVAEKIAFCERCYAERSLPAIFRLTSCLAPPELDEALERRGYRQLDPSLVLAMELWDRPLPEPALELRSEAIDTWMQLFEQLADDRFTGRETHHAMLEAISAERLLAAYVEGESVIGCGVGVLEGQYFGLFDLAVAQGQRNRGYGTQLIAAMLRWARLRGAGYAYLQVMRTNAPARHVYGKLGFEEACHYWYRALA
jgi:ribosomal protein S18 acetylase RimI-like enzyme